jgi:DNA polymerase-3 subunit delta'
LSVFRDVIGHRRLVSLLVRSIRQESLPPSLIFAGPSGVGKRLVALAVAQALNCPNRSDIPLLGGFDACGRCPTCARIARGVHPDVLFVEPGESGSIKIEQVRDIVDRAGYRPFEGRRRVVVVDEADALVPQAQNALLKTLEEPPPSSVFILVTCRPDTLLATVRSRCPRLRFRPLDADEVAKALVKQGRSESEARAVAAAADGSIGHALAVSAGELVDARDTALEVLAQAAVSGDRLDAAKKLVAKASGAARSVDREQLASQLRAMASLVRDVELVSTCGKDEAMANADVRPMLGRLQAFRGDRGLRAFAAIDRALAALDRNAGIKVVADWLVLQL